MPGHSFKDLSNVISVIEVRKAAILQAALMKKTGNYAGFFEPYFSVLSILEKIIEGFFTENYVDFLSSEF
ncbi:MAG: hypothetical protein C6W54_07360 [Bacillaceae bacterium]|nr:MAG: hypothetical protein C6W54_07360 [Bacillaceae bacterium]